MALWPHAMPLHGFVGGLMIGLLAGLLFGAGLTVSGMADAARVRAFLDIFGHWDPTLAFVMGGALLPMAASWRLRHAPSAAKNRGADLLSKMIKPQTQNQAD